MLDVLQIYVTQTGFAAVKFLPEKDQGDAKLYVETLLATYAQFSELVRKAFENNPPFVAALDKACRYKFIHTLILFSLCYSSCTGKL